MMVYGSIGLGISLQSKKHVRGMYISIKGEKNINAILFLLLL